MSESPVDKFEKCSYFEIRRYQNALSGIITNDLLKFPSIYSVEKAITFYTFSFGVFEFSRPMFPVVREKMLT